MFPLIFLHILKDVHVLILVVFFVDNLNYILHNLVVVEHIQVAYWVLDMEALDHFLEDKVELAPVGIICLDFPAQLENAAHRKGKQYAHDNAEDGVDHSTILYRHFLSVNFFDFDPGSPEEVNPVGKTILIPVDNPADSGLDDKLGAFQAWRGCHIKS